MRKSAHDQKVVESKNIGLDIDLGQKVKSTPKKLIRNFDHGNFLRYR